MTNNTTHNTHNPWEDAAKEHEYQRTELMQARKQMHEMQSKINRYEGRIEALSREVEDLKTRKDHYLGLYYETVKQLNTIGLVIDDAIHTARLEFPQRSNQNGGGNTQPQQVEQHIEAVEKALTDMSQTHTEPSAEDIARKYAPPKHRNDSNKHE